MHFYIPRRGAVPSSNKISNAGIDKGHQPAAQALQLAPKAKEEENRVKLLSSAYHRITGVVEVRQTGVMKTQSSEHPKHLPIHGPPLDIMAYAFHYCWFTVALARSVDI